MRIKLIKGLSWVKASDFLPKEYEHVLLMTGHGTVQNQIYYLDSLDEKTRVWQDGAGYDDPISISLNDQWRLLPSPQDSAWIAISSKRPKYGIPVLLCNHLGVVQKVTFHRDGGDDEADWWQDTAEVEDPIQIHHDDRWMPLPTKD
ncbi:hypothetical protein D3C87_703210 [compost metagenome]